MKLLSLPLLLLATVSFGQTPPGQSEPPVSRSEEVATSVFRRLSKEVSERSGNRADAGAIGRNPMRVIFLVDTAQATAKDYYSPFVGKVVAGLLRKIGSAQLAAKASDDALDDVWFYPYQMDLIQDPSYTLQAKRLKRGGGTVRELVDKIPRKRVPVRGEGNLGHDSSKARRTLINLLGPAQAARETVIVQITPMPVNSDPEHPENHRRITQIDARSGLLEGTDYVVYDDDGRYYQTDPPGGSLAPSDVHVWLYGPARFDVPPPLARVDPSKTEPSSETSLSRRRLPIGPIASLAFLAAAILVAAWRCLRKQKIAVGGIEGRASLMSPLAIETDGGKIRDNTLALTPDRRGRIGPGLKVAEVTVPFLGAPKLVGAGGYRIVVNNAERSDVSLDAKGLAVSFGRGDERSEPVKVELR